MKLSVVVTCFNYGRFVEQCLNSILDQQFHEIIVVDDGSTDNSVEILRSYGKSIILIEKSNGGQGSAFNVGFSRVTGDFVWFLDADDYALPEAVCIIKRNWRANYSMLHARCFVESDGVLLSRKFPRRFVPLPFGYFAPMYCIFAHYASPPTSGKVFSTKFLKNIFPIPEFEYRICADAYLHDAAPGYGAIGIADENFAVYRVHGRNNFYNSKKNFTASSAAMRIKRIGNKMATCRSNCPPDFVWIHDFIANLNPEIIKLLEGGQFGDYSCMVEKKLLKKEFLVLVKIANCLIRFKLVALYSFMWRVFVDVLNYVYSVFDYSDDSPSQPSI